MVEGIGSLSPPGRAAQPLVPLAGSTMRSKGFARDGVYFTTDASSVPEGITLYGSWLGTDASTGSFTSAWYPSTLGSSVMVAGYPTHPNMLLELEVKSINQSIRTVQITVVNPQETWSPVILPLPQDSTSFRIHAADLSRSFEGWLGVSEPFVLSTTPAEPSLGRTGKISLYVAGLLDFVLAIGCALLAWRFGRSNTQDES